MLIENFNENDAYDAVVIGGGPAGSTCALWLKHLGYRPIVIDARASLGGLQNDSPFLNDWITPLPGLKGSEIAASIHRNIASHDIPCLLDTQVASIRAGVRRFHVRLTTLRSQKVISAPHIVLATGVRPERGGLIQGDRLLIGPGHQIMRADFTGRSVAILGGGDNAFENYQEILGRRAAEVHVYARSIRARQSLLQGAAEGDIKIGPYDVDAEAMRVAGRPYDYIVVLYGC